ncbi:MAG: carboxypeptidase-like regulatory domain-containing protein, partial [Acidobacteriota bacterium]
MIRWALFLVLAGGLGAQAPQYEIRGTVTEVGFGGLGAVEVFAQVPTAGDPISIKTITDANGAFVLKVPAPQTYYLVAQRAGYGSTERVSAVTLNVDHPKQEVQIHMVRP